MKVIAFASSKGGVGKSTSCAALAAYLAGQGANVHLLDLDPNETLGQWTGIAPLSRVTVQAVQPRDFMPSLKAVLEAGEADYIFIDLPGVREVTILKAIQCSDLVIIPAQHSIPDVRQALEIVGDVEDSIATTGREIPYRLLFTKTHNLISKLDRHVEAQVDAEKIQRFGCYLVDRVAYREMFANGVAPHKRDAKAALELQGLSEQIAAIIDAEPASDRKAGAA